ncbi:MAG: thiosulfate oxidation carrier protein SoxY [Burkholderiales bacterium]|nr:thiosulfate oxidation carrier protein SoxY [Burkholderiales bacterium]
MNRSRRTLLKAASFLAGVALGGGMLRSVFAADWNAAAFDAVDINGAMKGIGVAAATFSKDIEIQVPQIAENGAVVPIQVTSRIPNTRFIAILVEKNPFPLIAQINFLNGAEGYVSTRIKMGESSNIKAVVQADGKFYSASKDVKVTIGGCGE